MKAVVDQELCIGCGVCEQICPEVFKLDDGIRAVVIVETVPPEFQKTCEEAAQGCPVSAISIK